MGIPEFVRVLKQAWKVTDEAIEDQLAIKAAADEAVESQLPGREDGPADAYRHLLWGAELTRKFGADNARTILEGHEIQGTISTMIRRERQTPEATAMDRRNNALAIMLGKTARTWDEVKLGAQRIMDRSDPSGSGVDGGAAWLTPSLWKGHPKDEITGEELPPTDWNWPDIDWINGRVPNPVPYVYPYGGEEYRREPAIDNPLPLGPAGAAVVNPLSLPVAGWSEDDLRQVMASAAYQQPGHPGRPRAHAMVRAWFEQDAAIEPAQVDATGRQVRARMAAAPASGSCEVPVREHTREGGRVEVEAHCRARPAA
jgi:hypothetical protein